MNNEQNMNQEALGEKVENDNKKELEQSQAEVAQCKEQLMRVTAEFENARKRMEREREQWARMAQASVIEKLLPVIDNMDRAAAELPKTIPAEVEGWFKGFSMTVMAFKKYLDSIGVKEVDAQEFNPEFHEAIMSAESDKPAGSIVQVFEKGYTFKDQVLRPAKVSVVKE